MRRTPFGMVCARGERDLFHLVRKDGGREVLRLLEGRENQHIRGAVPEGRPPFQKRKKKKSQVLPLKKEKKRSIANKRCQTRGRVFLHHKRSSPLHYQAEMGEI